MKRRRLLIAVLASPALATRAQQPRAMRRVGLLAIESESTPSWLALMREGLREHGFIEGKNLQFEYRRGIARYEQLAGAAQELVQSKVDVIASFGDTATRAAIKATTVIPIVMRAGADPVEAGFVPSLARPGGNVTGITLFSKVLLGKRLEILKDAVPRLRVVAVLVDPASPDGLDSFRQLEGAAKTLGLTLQKIEIRSPDDIETAIAAAVKNGANALSAIPSSSLRRYAALTARAALANRLPSMFSVSTYVTDGGLMSYSAKPGEGPRRQGHYIGRILKGDKPGNLPIEQPTQFELVVNMKTARALGLTIAPTVMVRADRVIE